MSAYSEALGHVRAAYSLAVRWEVSADVKEILKDLLDEYQAEPEDSLHTGDYRYLARRTESANARLRERQRDYGDDMPIWVQRRLSKAKVALARDLRRRVDRLTE